MLVEEDLIEYGTDISSTWNLNSDGDLEIVTGKDNIVQSVLNRLNTNIHEFSLYYTEYGSFLSSFMGWRADDALGFMDLEIKTVLSQDPRISDCNVELNYLGDGVINAGILLVLSDESEVELDLNINSVEGTVENNEEEED